MNLLRCPGCDAAGSLSVKETRQSAGMIYRTRMCCECKGRFITEKTFSESVIPKHARAVKMSAHGTCAA